MFEIGDKVICINDKWVVNSDVKFTITFPEYEQMYTIRDIVFCNGKKALLLEEIHNVLVRDSNNYIGEICFNVIHFVKPTTVEDILAEVGVWEEECV